MSFTGPQVEARALGIGGSDAAALSVDPYKSALALYLEKNSLPAGGGVRIETPAMMWGRLLFLPTSTASPRIAGCSKPRPHA
jgi:hypothetical protein